MKVDIYRTPREAVWQRWAGIHARRVTQSIRVLIVRVGPISVSLVSGLSR